METTINNLRKELKELKEKGEVQEEQINSFMK
jgi:ribosomal protein L19E